MILFASKEDKKTSLYKVLLYIMNRIMNLLSSSKPIKWLFYGDSITHGVVHCTGFQNYPELFSERIRGEMERCDDLVLNSAISGNTTVELLECFDHRVKEFHPNVAFLMIGMNDCFVKRNISLYRFEKNLNLLVEPIAKVLALCC